MKTDKPSRRGKRKMARDFLEIRDSILNMVWSRWMSDSKDKKNYSMPSKKAIGWLGIASAGITSSLIALILTVRAIKEGKKDSIKKLVKNPPIEWTRDSVEYITAALAEMLNRADPNSVYRVVIVRHDRKGE